MLKACLESLTSPRQTIKNSGVFSTDELTISDNYVCKNCTDCLIFFFDTLFILLLFT